MENTLENKILLSTATDQVRIEFYKKTYKHVAGGVLLFIIFEYLLLQSDVIVLTISAKGLRSESQTRYQTQKIASERNRDID